MKFTPETTKRIAIFRALQLGDMLCSVPAMRALRAAYPDAEITLLGLPWAASFCRRFSKYIDHFVHFPGFPGLPEQPFKQQEYDHFADNIRARSFDLILQMQGNGSIVNNMLENLNAGTVAGFHSEGSYGPKDLFIEYPTDVHEIKRHILLMEHLGISSQGTDLEYPVSEMEKLGLFSKFPVILSEDYICIHPGSRGEWRQWPPAHFARLADYCAGAGYNVIVTGTKEEAPVTKKVIELMNYPAIDLTGQTSLGEIGALIGKAKMLISNCTGVSHISSALNTPSIVISMDGEPGRWGPLNQDLHKTFDWTADQNFDNILLKTRQLLTWYDGFHQFHAIIG